MKKRTGVLGDKGLRRKPQLAIMQLVNNRYCRLIFHFKAFVGWRVLGGSAT